MLIVKANEPMPNVVTLQLMDGLFAWMQNVLFFNRLLPRFHSGILRRKTAFTFHQMDNKARVANGLLWVFMRARVGKQWPILTCCQTHDLWAKNIFYIF
jgi:hypothetical protein